LTAKTAKPVLVRKLLSDGRCDLILLRCSFDVYRVQQASNRNFSPVGESAFFKIQNKNKQEQQQNKQPTETELATVLLLPFIR